MTKPIQEQSYSGACCREMQKVAQEDYVEMVSKDRIYLIKTYDLDEGDGYSVTMTDSSKRLIYCPFCGKLL